MSLLDSFLHKRTMPPIWLDKRVIVFAAFFLAFLVRAIFVLQWNDTPYGAVPFLDAQAYDDWAMKIAGGELLRSRAFYQSPLYPYVLGLFYSVTGHKVLFAGLLNALLDAGTVAVLTAITFGLFGAVAAIGTAVLATFFRPMIFYTAPVMKEPLALFLLSLFLLFAFAVLRGNKWRDYVLCGCYLGLGALARGNVLLLAPVFLVLALLKWGRSALVKCLAFVLFLVLFIAPATIHNAIVSRDFVPIGYTDGFNLYIGYSEYANGVNAYPPEVSTDPIQEEFNTTWIAEQKIGRKMKPSEVSAYWQGRAFEFILAKPLQTAGLLKNKIEAFWNTAERFDNYDINFIRDNFDTILSAPLLGFWAVSFLAALGAVFLWKEYRQKVAVLLCMTTVYMISVIMFYVTDRYRLPVVVFLLPLAGAALPAGAEIVRQKNWQRFATAAIISGTFLYLGLMGDPFPVDLSAFNWGMLAMIYEDQGRHRESLQALEKAVAISPVEAGAQAFVRGSYALQALGRENEAEQYLLKAMEIFPDNGLIMYNYGRLKAFEGKLPEAALAIEKAAVLMPYYVLNYQALAMIYAKQGDKLRAKVAVEKGLLLDPEQKDILAIEDVLAK